MFSRLARRGRNSRVQPELWATWGGDLPETISGQVVFAVLTKFGFHGKANAARYFPEFCRVLRAHDLSVRFCTDLGQVDALLSQPMPTVLVNVFPEDRMQIWSKELESLEAKAVAVYNRASLGPILADKAQTANFFDENDLPRPPPFRPDAAVFSNSRFGSHKGAALVEAGKAIDTRRHNTAFIDTSVPFGSKSYHTTGRLLAIDGEIAHAFVRARDAKDDDPSVHEGDTPDDPDLLAFLHTELVEPRRAEFGELARRLAGAMGPGFYVHDILIERDSDRIFVCESGLKFDYGLNWLRFEPKANLFPSFGVMFPLESYAAHCGAIFAKQCRNYISNAAA